MNFTDQWVVVQLAAVQWVTVQWVAVQWVTVQWVVTELYRDRTISRHIRYSDMSCMSRNRSVDERYRDRFLILQKYKIMT